ncbi:surface protease GP63 [Trypanosoma theileri]|uniref:Leishmanolysin-like peptidase n=1 Tax=Trypanosoma theileri TaxID=67003 RepID=A0A1X0NQW6_9TRYP|nr:surface protease GP63 [Trypanosoma theileri]ORC87084.1 surface protease GP63 [Trypanosoma theileri]
MTKQANKLSARTPATVRQSLYVMPLLLLLLFLCCACVCVAQKDGGVQSTGVVRELPRKGQSGVQAYTVSAQEKDDKEWKLIRIKASTKDLEDASRYCTKIGEQIIDFEGDEVVCDEEDILTDEKKKTIINTILPAAIKLHKDRLRVQPHEGKLKVPNFEDGSDCEYFTVPDEHHTEGVENADFVFYVGSGPGTSFGVTCAPEDLSSRPIAGAMNIAVFKYAGLRLSVRSIAHEMAHALGFDYERMKELNMVTTVTNVRDKDRVLVNTAVTKEKAQEHYNCPELQGMELNNEEQEEGEDQEEDEVSSHWSVRLARDELMAPPTGLTAGYYTALTMSTFEGLGYYKANWGMEEPMSWGHKGGCDFINGSCMTNGVTAFPKTFCNDTKFRCTSDRHAIGRCELSKDVESKVFLDQCPTMEPIWKLEGEEEEEEESSPTSLCTDGEEGLFPGSLTGEDSWCLDAESLTVVTNKRSMRNAIRGVCARVKCSSGGGVKVQYKGNDKWHDCPEGKSIDVRSSAFTNGKIKCPKYDEVCTITPDGRSRLSMNVELDSTRRAAALSALVPLAMTFTLMGLL